jgi:hypothetical protein
MSFSSNKISKENVRKQYLRDNDSVLQHMLSVDASHRAQPGSRSAYLNTQFNVDAFVTHCNFNFGVNGSGSSAYLWWGALSDDVESQDWEGIYAPDLGDNVIEFDIEFSATEDFSAPVNMGHVVYANATGNVIKEGLGEGQTVWYRVKVTVNGIQASEPFIVEGSTGYTPSR